MSKNRHLLFFAVILLVIGMDQASKAWVLHSFALYESREVIPGFFNLTYLTNNGAAFSLLAGQPALWRQVFFVSASVLALFFIWIAQRSYGPLHWCYTVSLALIAGGAIGNLVDRLRFGFVIDFLDVYFGSYHWPTFNVADSAICVGAGLFLLATIRLDHKQSPSDNPPPASHSFCRHPL